VLRWRVNWAKQESQHASLPLATSGHGTAELSPDGQTIATLDESRLLFWDAKSGEYRGSLAGDATLRQARFCTQPLEGTNRIAVADEQGHLQMWAGDDAPRQTTSYVGGVVRSMYSLAHSGSLICAGDFPHVALLDPTQPSSHQRVPRERPATHLAAAPQASPVLALADWDGTIDVCQLRAATGELIWQQTLATATMLVDLRISADGRLLAAATADGRLLSWRRDTQGAYAAADAPSHTLPSIPHCLLLSGDGQQCWVGTGAGTLVGWTFDPAAGVWRSAGERTLHQAAVRAVQWLTDGNVASIGDDARLVVYDVNGNRLVAAVPQPSANCLATHAAAGLLAVGSGDDVHVWRLENGQLRRQGQPLSEHNGPVVALAFTADGQQLVSSSQDRSLKFWPVELFGGPSRSPVPEHIRQMFERRR
jgi:WD40 repeat protein